MKGKKFLLSVLASVLLFIIPIVAAAGVVATPIVAIAEFFSSLFNHPHVSQEVIDLMETYIQTEEGKYEIHHVYEPFILKTKIDKGVEIPLEWLVFPNFVSEISSFDEVGDDPKDITSYLETLEGLMIEKKEEVVEVEEGEEEVETVITYHLVEESLYLSRLKSKYPWGSYLKDFSTDLLSKYLHASNRLSSLASQSSRPIISEGGIVGAIFNGELPEYQSGYYTLPGNAFGNGLIAQCTWYVANRYLEFGINIGGWGNGGDWWWQARDRGHTLSKIPQVGWAVSMPPYSLGTLQTGPWAMYGHIAFVEEVHDGYIVVSEMGAGVIGSYKVREIPRFYYDHYWFIDFGLRPGQ